MKTRFLIIIGISIVITMSLSYHTLYNSSDIFIACTPEYEQIDGECLLKTEQYCKDWCEPQELSKLGCDHLTLDYIYRATNLFDENFGNVYYRNFIELPDGVTEEQFEKCAKIIHEKRILVDSNAVVLEPDNQQCADHFDKLLQEEREPYVPCNSSTDNDGNTAVCEPKSLGDGIMQNDTFNQTGCPLIYRDWAYLTGDNDLAHGIYSPRYELEMEKTNLDRHIPISVEKWGFDACDSFYLRIIDHDNGDEELSLIAYEDICMSQSEQIKRQKFVYDLEPVELPFGNYVVYLHDDDPRNSNDVEHMQELTKFYFSSHYKIGSMIELDGIKQTDRSTLEITGRTNDVENEIILNLYNPDGIFVTQDALIPDSDGKFSTILTVGGSLFKLSGYYTITLQQGDAVQPQVSRIFDLVK